MTTVCGGYSMLYCVLIICLGFGQYDAQSTPSNEITAPTTGSNDTLLPPDVVTAEPTSGTAIDVTDVANETATESTLQNAAFQTSEAATATTTSVAPTLAIPITPAHVADDMSDATMPSQMEPPAYKCFLNNTFVVENPNPSLYTDATTYVLDTPNIYCDADFDNMETRLQLVITGCGKDSDLVVTFMSGNPDDLLLQADHAFTTFNVRCNEISEEGFTRSLKLAFTPEVKATTLPSATPSLLVEVNVRGNTPVGTVLTTAHIGDKLYWTIDLPDLYKIVPITCSASPAGGPDADTTVELMSNGCSTRPGVFDDFISSGLPIGGDMLRYSATFVAFRFRTYPYVTISCDVKVCLLTSLSCDFECPNSRRKRALVTSLEEDEKEKRVQTETKLRILDLRPDIIMHYPSMAPMQIGNAVLLAICFLISG